MACNLKLHMTGDSEVNQALSELGFSWSSLSLRHKLVKFLAIPLEVLFLMLALDLWFMNLELVFWVLYSTVQYSRVQYRLIKAVAVYLDVAVNLALARDSAIAVYLAMVVYSAIAVYLVLAESILLQPKFPPK